MSELLVGAVAYDPKVVTIWEIIREVVKEEGFSLDYVLFSNYEAQVQALIERRIDLAWNTNTAYVRTHLAADGACRPLLMRDTDLNYHSKLVTRANSGINSLSDLRGRKVAFGSRDSGHAAILPLYFLQQSGIDPNKDIRPMHLDLDVGKHGDTGTSEQEVLRLVQSGQADAGFVGDPLWVRALQQGWVDGSQVRSVWTSPPYNHCNFTALADFSSEAQEAFTSAFLSMAASDPRVKRMMELEGLSRWVPGRQEGYESLFAALA